MYSQLASISTLNNLKNEWSHNFDNLALISSFDSLMADIPGSSSSLLDIVVTAFLAESGILLYGCACRKCCILRCCIKTKADALDNKLSIDKFNNVIPLHVDDIRNKLLFDIAPSPGNNLFNRLFWYCSNRRSIYRVTGSNQSTTVFDVWLAIDRAEDCD